MNESWQPIPGWEGFYEASDQGRVRSVERWVTRSAKGGSRSRHHHKGQVLSQFVGAKQTGRLSVGLNMQGKKKKMDVHCLVAYSFIGPRPEGFEIDHVNGNPLDNRACNLEYVTTQENVRRARAMGKVGGKDRHPVTGQYMPCGNG